MSRKRKAAKAQRSIAKKGKSARCNLLFLFCSGVSVFASLCLKEEKYPPKRWRRLSYVRVVNASYEPKENADDVGQEDRARRSRQQKMGPRAVGEIQSRPAGAPHRVRHRHHGR